MLRRIGTIFDSTFKNYVPRVYKKVKSDKIDSDATDSSDTQQEKIEKLAENGQRYLLQISTVFPFKFFPDDLIIDSLKVSHVHRIFFFSEEIKSIFIENVRSVSISSGPFFSTLSIIDNVLTPNIIKVKPLIKKHALKAQAVLQGLIASKKEKIDTETISNQKSKIIENIGKVESQADS